MDTNGGTLGGGEILPFIGNETHKGTQYVDWNLVQQYASLYLVKAVICVLLAVVCILLVLRVFNIRSPAKNKGVTSEIKNVNALKGREKFIIRNNRILKKLTEMVQKTPFHLSSSSAEYWRYNLKRAGIKAPGGYRYLTSEEFNAICKVACGLLIGIGLLVCLLINGLMGFALIVMAVIVTAVLPNMAVRQIVKNKDLEIRENFPDFYLMLHYVLLMGGQTPLDKLMKSYAKTTDSPEMVRFVDNCVGHIDTTGEYGATALIAKDYREIPEVGKLCRLIKQMYDGADITQELLGFREELIKNRKYIITKRMNVLVTRAQTSFNLLMIILIQAIVSAMALYLPDLSGVGGLM